MKALNNIFWHDKKKINKIKTDSLRTVVWVEISHRRVNAQHKKTKRWVEYTEKEGGGREEERSEGKLEDFQ